MTRRLLPEEIRTINSNCKDDELFRFIYDVCLPLETKMSVVDLCPEEVFCECRYILDEMLNVGEGYENRVETLWHRLYNEYKRLTHADSEELRYTVAEVLTVVSIALTSSNYIFYRYTLPTEIMRVIVENAGDQKSVMHHIIKESEKYGDRIDGWLDRYIDSNIRDKNTDSMSNKPLSSKQQPMKFIQTNFEDNHSYVQVSGGTPNITINIQDGKAEVKKEEPVQEAEVVDDIVDELKKVFYGEEKTAKAFLDQINGMKPVQITELVKKYLVDGKLSDLSARRDLWSVLHNKGYYEPSESYWDRCIK